MSYFEKYTILKQIFLFILSLKNKFIKIYFSIKKKKISRII